MQLTSQKLIRIVKTNNSINDSKWRKRGPALSCSKKLSETILKLYPKLNIKQYMEKDSKAGKSR